MVTGRWLAVVLLLAGVVARADDSRPSFVAMSDGTVGVSLPGAALSDDEVKAQLKSGLTTTFVAVATALNRTRSVARIEVRYDLWDEKYLVRRVELDGSTTRSQFSSLEDLARWWRTTPLRLLPTGTPAGRVDLELRVLPFSAAEERDTREWLTKGGGSLAGRTASRDGGPATAGSAAMIETLIGTALEARPLLTFRWRVDLVRGAR